MDPLGDPLPDSDKNIATPIIILSAVLHALSLPVVAARIWSRARPKNRLWWDDYTILAAAAFDLANWILILLAIRHGLGRPTPSVPLDDQPLGRMYLYFGQHAAGWAIGAAKLSIALILYRLRRESLWWRGFLIGMMVLSVAIAGTTSGFLFAACKPLKAMWDYTTPNPVCIPPKLISKAIIGTSALTIATDFILSLLPLTFIARVKRSVRERVILAVIMGLGLVASSASVCKIVDALGELTGDTLLDGVNVTFWGILEIQLGIIAACVPCLKRLTERILIKLGLMSSRDGPTFYHIERDHSPGGDPRSPTGHGIGTPGYPRSDTEDAGWEMTPQGSAVGTKPWDAVMRNDNEHGKH